VHFRLFARKVLFSAFQRSKPMIDQELIDSDQLLIAGMSVEIPL